LLAAWITAPFNSVHSKLMLLLIHLWSRYLFSLSLYQFNVLFSFNKCILHVSSFSCFCSVFPPSFRQC
jgi:hypothetical protein